MIVTTYQGTKPKPARIVGDSPDVKLVDVLSAIRSGVWFDQVHDIRTCEQDSIRKSLKENLPSFTISGRFTYRKKENIVDHSGFIGIDIDGIEDIKAITDKAYHDPYVYAGFLSVSGKGLRLIFKIEPEKHAEAWEGINRYLFTKYNVTADPAAKDVPRLCFISFDPALHLNEKARTFKEYVRKPKGRPANRIAHTPFADSDFEHTLQQIEEKRIDLTSTYYDWVRIGLALKSHFGDAGEQVFHRVSQFHPDYDYDRTAKKWKSLRPQGDVKIATFFHLCKQAGIQVMSTATREVARFAMYAKKGAAKGTRNDSPEDVAHLIEETQGVPKEKTIGIIEQVMSTFSDVDMPEDGDKEKAAIYIRSTFDIKFNLITHRVEVDGEEITDRTLNYIYLNCAKVVKSISKSDVDAIINSADTPAYNPVTDWFTKRKFKGAGFITMLASTLETPKGATETEGHYAEMFLRKWMIGAVAMWHGNHSPLMLILAGERQGTGKTEFFRRMLPEDLQEYYAEGRDVSSKDEAMLMAEKILILDDEMSAHTRQEIAEIKRICSMDKITFRRPYARYQESLHRMAALAGTSNNLEILQDPTGNRRFVPIEVLSINHERYNQVDKEALWLEAYRAWKSGEEYHLSKFDIEVLNARTQKFEAVRPEAELVQRYFMPATDAMIGVSHFTNTDIRVYIESRTQLRLSSKVLGQELKRLGFKQDIIRDGTGTRRVYLVAEIVQTSTLRDSRSTF
jgi:hypothetical protein